MALLGARGFRGEVPRTSPRLLPENFARSAVNVKLTSGRINPLARPLLTHTSTIAAIKSMYHYRGYDGLLQWMVWDEQVDVVPSPAKQDVFERIYFSGDLGPRMTVADEAFDGPGPYPAACYTLGVTPPRAGATLTPPAGTGDIRTYAFRFVTRFSEPSGIVDRGVPNTVTATGAPTGSWELTTLPPPPANAVSLSSATIAGGVCTLALSGTDPTYGWDVGDSIVISGTAGIAGLNAEHQLIAVDHAGHTMKIRLNSSGTAAAGTVTRRIPHNLTGLKRQIYRTTGSNADWLFVAEIDATATSYTDAVAAGDLGELLDSADLLPPPKVGSRIAVLANGALALLTEEGELVLSSTKYPSGFPVGNRYAAPGGVALVAVRNTLLVLTSSYPLYLVAERPEAGSPGKIGEFAPCVSARSVIPTSDGALYAGHDGFYFAGLGGAQLQSAAIWTRDEWEPLQPATMMAAPVDQQIVVAYSTPDAGQMLLMDKTAPDSIVHVTESADAMHRSTATGRLYIAKGSLIYEWDADDDNRYLGTWRSRDSQFAPPLNLGAAQVMADFQQLQETPNDSTLLANQALFADPQLITGAYGDFEFGSVEFAGSNIEEVSQTTERKVQVTLYSRDAVKFSKTINDSKAFRLPAGFKSEVVAIGVTTSVPVDSVLAAGSIDELKTAGV